MAMKKILIADDDESIVDATAMMLEVMGYEVSYTLDGRQVPALVRNKPDLLLLDIWMSGVDGRDVCRTLKSDPETSDVPVLMISASRDIEASALACGANGFLPKPFEMDELAGLLERLIGD
jgi:CheY-like chemotaxis protein